jgi:bacterioferritin (cytochrome b1)
VLNTGGLLRIAAMARASPSKPVVKEVEERALADVEETADALIKQLENADRHGVRTYSSSCF